jgi:nucleoside-triphosphatase
MGKTLLLTGHPRIGKTTIIRKVIEKLGDRVGGFYTEEIFGPGGRKGFKLITLDGKEIILSHKDFRDPKMPRVGRYGVDIKALDNVGVTAIQQTVQAGKILVVDEIGKMELFSKSFREVMLSAILGPTPILGTIIYKPYPAADIFKALAQVTIWEVNMMNRAKLHRKVLKWCA